MLLLSKPEIKALKMLMTGPFSASFAKFFVGLCLYEVRYSEVRLIKMAPINPTKYAKKGLNTLVLKTGELCENEVKVESLNAVATPQMMMER